MPTKRILARLAMITLAILLIPLFGTVWSDEVTWSPFDFVFAGALLFGAGLAFEVVSLRSSATSYRVATGLACAAALLLIWVNLAVGLIGSENNPANALYLGVLLTGGVGAAIARLRPLGMSRALFATTIVQALVPFLALAIWRPGVAGPDGLAEMIGVFVFNSLFVLLFAASGLLYLRSVASFSNPPSTH